MLSPPLDLWGEIGTLSPDHVILKDRMSEPRLSPTNPGLSNNVELDSLIPSVLKSEFSMIEK